MGFAGFKARKIFTLDQLERASNEIIDRYQEKMDYYRYRNACEYAKMRDDLRSWQQQVMELYLLPLTEKFVDFG